MQEKDLKIEKLNNIISLKNTEINELQSKCQKLENQLKGTWKLEKMTNPRYLPSQESNPKVSARATVMFTSVPFSENSQSPPTPLVSKTKPSQPRPLFKAELNPNKSFSNPPRHNPDLDELDRILFDTSLDDIASNSSKDIPSTLSALSPMSSSPKDIPPMSSSPKVMSSSPISTITDQPVRQSSAVHEQSSPQSKPIDVPVKNNSSANSFKMLSSDIQEPTTFKQSSAPTQPPTFKQPVPIQQEAIVSGPPTNANVRRPPPKSAPTRRPPPPPKR